MKERVRGYLAEGLSASQIGRHFGVSRSAIVGLVHRNPVLRATGFKRAPSQKYLKPKTVKRTVVVRRASNIVNLFKDPQPVEGYPIYELRPNQCRWPVNDAAVGETHLFCGDEVSNKCYCPKHWAMRNGTGTESERGAHRGVAA